MGSNIFASGLPPVSGSLPVGGTVAVLKDLLLSRGGGGWRNSVEQKLADFFDAEDIVLTLDGKDALCRLFQAIKNKTRKNLIGVPAYTCPDIVSSAVAAGCKVLPLDVNPATLAISTDLNREQLENFAAVVLGNLYGIAEDIGIWQKVAAHYGFVIIDDGCQGALSITADGRVGARQAGEASCFGVVSFGRGKGLNGVGGGAVILPNNRTKAINISREDLSFKTDDYGSRGLKRECKDLIKLIASSLVGNSKLYGFAATMPFLRLGETIIHTDIPSGEIGVVQAAVAIAQLNYAEERADYFHQRAVYWAKLLRDGVVQPAKLRYPTALEGISPIRYPIVLKDLETRELVHRLLQENGLGCSRSYPRAITDYPQLGSAFEHPFIPTAGEMDVGAKEVAGRILTLPVHQLVEAADQEFAASIILRVIKADQ